MYLIKKSTYVVKGHSSTKVRLQVSGHSEDPLYRVTEGLKYPLPYIYTKVQEKLVWSSRRKKIKCEYFSGVYFVILLMVPRFIRKTFMNIDTFETFFCVTRYEVPLKPQEPFSIGVCQGCKDIVFIEPVVFWTQRPKPFYHREDFLCSDEEA